MEESWFPIETCGWLYNKNRYGETVSKIMMNFVLNMMDFVLNMMDFVFKTRIRHSEGLGAIRHALPEGWRVDWWHTGANHEYWMKNKELCIKMMKFVSKTRNVVWKRMNFADCAVRLGELWIKMMNFVFKMMNFVFKMMKFVSKMMHLMPGGLFHNRLHGVAGVRFQ